MALVEVRASFLCDGCGRPFSIRMDPASGCLDDWTVFDMAEDAVRGSIDYRGPRNDNGTNGSSSVQDDKHLCGPCTAAADAAVPEGDPF